MQLSEGGVLNEWKVTVSSDVLCGSRELGNIVFFFFFFGCFSGRVILMRIQ